MNNMNLDIPNISLREFKDSEEDYQKLYKWCQNKHVYEWFEQRILTYEEIYNKYHNKIKKQNQDLYIIRLNGRDIGLVQIYKYPGDIKLEKIDKYQNLYEYDLYIGETAYLSKGYGPIIIGIINGMIYTKYHADAIILRPFKRNGRAINCYLKSKFKLIHEYLGKDTIGNKEAILVLLNTKKSK